MISAHRTHRQLIDVFSVNMYDTESRQAALAIEGVNGETEDMMLFEQVRIPLYRENGMARDTRSFANDLRKYLNQKANLTCKVMTKGLGKAELVIGEK